MVTVAVDRGTGWAERTKTLGGGDVDWLADEWTRVEFPRLLNRALMAVPEEPADDEPEAPR